MNVPYDPYNLKGEHSAAQYKAALLACRSILKGKRYLEMLRANYDAPDHKLTAGEMARAVGYANWHSANLQYGTFAGAIAEKLGYARGKLVGVGVSATPDVACLVSFGGGKGVGEDVTWQLLPQVVQALEQLPAWLSRRQP